VGPFTFIYRGYLITQYVCWLCSSVILYFPHKRLQSFPLFFADQLGGAGAPTAAPPPATPMFPRQGHRLQRDKAYKRLK